MCYFLSNIQTISKLNFGNMRFNADIRIQLGQDTAYVIHVTSVNINFSQRHFVIFLVYMVPTTLMFQQVLMLVGIQITHLFQSIYDICSGVRDIIVGLGLQLVCYTSVPGTIFDTLCSTWHFPVCEQSQKRTRKVSL